MIIYVFPTKVEALLFAFKIPQQNTFNINISTNSPFMAIEAYFSLACIPKSSSLYPLPSSKATSIFSGFFFYSSNLLHGTKICLLGQLLTKYHRLCGSNNNNLFSHNSGSWKDKSESSLFLVYTFSACPHMAFLWWVKKESEDRTLVFLLIRILILSAQGPTLTTSFNHNYFLKFSSQNTDTLVLEFNIWIWGGQTFSL